MKPTIFPDASMICLLWDIWGDGDGAKQWTSGAEKNCRGPGKKALGAEAMQEVRGRDVKWWCSSSPAGSGDALNGNWSPAKLYTHTPHPPLPPPSPRSS